MRDSNSHSRRKSSRLKEKNSLKHVSWRCKAIFFSPPWNFKNHVPLLSCLFWLIFCLCQQISSFMVFSCSICPRLHLPASLCSFNKLANSEVQLLPCFTSNHKHTPLVHLEPCYSISSWPWISNLPHYSLSTKINFIGVQLIYNVVLVSSIQQNDSIIHIHVYAPF